MLEDMVGAATAAAGARPGANKKPQPTTDKPVCPDASKSESLIFQSHKNTRIIGHPLGYGPAFLT